MDTPQPSTHGLGLVPQGPDSRDLQLAEILPTLPNIVIPAKVDWQQYDPPIGDQGNTSACAGWSSTRNIMFWRAKAGLPFVDGSADYTYFYARKRGGNAATDSGSTLRNNFASLGNEGLAGNNMWPTAQSMVLLDPEVTWRGLATAWSKPPYTVNGYQLTQDPQFSAHHHRALTYRAVDCTVAAFRTALAQGFSISFGIPVFESFWATGADGMTPEPNPSTEHLYGYHAVRAIGYDDSISRFHVVNQWGESFGQGGRCWLPYTWLATQEAGKGFFDAWSVHFAT